MLDLTQAKRIAIVGGGVAGWFAALVFRRLFGDETEVVVFADEGGMPPVAQDGGLLNMAAALTRNGLDVEEFIRETGATSRLGVAFHNWRKNTQAEAGDVFYHLMPMPGEQVAEIDHMAFGFAPLLAARVAAGADLHSFFPGFSLIRNKSSQREAQAVLATKRSGLSQSWHFDCRRFARYLRGKALTRGVREQAGRVDKLVVNEHGAVTAVAVNGAQAAVDFVVDASGLRRIGLGQTYKESWCSLHSFLPVDTMQPFSRICQQGQLPLLTKATALSSGWLWQVPLANADRGYMGGAYLFSSAHGNVHNMQAELVQHLGAGVQLAQPLRFEAGHFKVAWRNNLVALGAAAGFVEPLEATAMGQMLESLRNIERMISDGGGVVGHQAIFSFNRSSYKTWDTISDFLRMHYEGGRQDTPFWQAVAQLPRSGRYQEIRRAFARRLPRAVDLESYIGYGWGAMFHMVNWLSIGAAVGVVPQQAGVADLKRLPRNMLQEVGPYLKELRKRMGQEMNVSGKQAGQ
ncbi:MAG: Tryptophan halogenase [Candidatus Tokpelaia hoelldobleri]|uniref:Tryptophan halogenase n=1 Tax=Candidatus Tokpelaia hoelldobleri TaxID=1902579 RepID=A0A1U9JVN3_9HYPH|nr:MAG: Tryptophan halogenase [Candidatus Tokpelaia hoelldoblerii]